MGAGRLWAIAAAGVVILGAAVYVLNHQIRLRDNERLDNAQAALDSGIRLYQQGLLEEAEAQFRRADEGNPDEWRPPFYLGVIQIQLGRYESAIPYLEEAFIRDPTQPKIPNALGVAYFKLGKLDLAKGYFATSLDLDLGNADTRSMVETMTRLQRRAAQAVPAPEN